MVDDITMAVVSMSEGSPLGDTSSIAESSNNVWDDAFARENRIDT